jgi:heme A synthase
LGGVAFEALLGIGSGPVVGALHALLAQLTFAGTVAISLITSKTWSDSPDHVDDSPRLSLRALSLATLVLVILQVSLGAAYRHQAMGVVPHIIGALVVTIAILLTSVLVTNLYPEHRALRPAAKTLIGITFTQVMLGMAAFITRLMMAQGTLPVVIAGVAHVAIGSLTLATAALLTLLIRRYVRPVS